MSYDEWGLAAAMKTAMAQAWDEGYEAGSDDEAGHARGVTMAEISQYTPTHTGTNHERTPGPQRNDRTPTRTLA